MHEDLRNMLAPLESQGWEAHFPAWRAGAGRALVIQPAGGGDDLLIREPVFRVWFIAAAGEADAFAAYGAALEARQLLAAGRVGVTMLGQCGEPAYQPTTDNRHVYTMMCRCKADATT